MDKEEKKRLTKEFKETEFGKKAFRNYVIAFIFFMIALVIEAVLFFCNVGIGDYHSVEICVFVITCYYEGFYCGSLALYLKQHENK